MSATKRERWDAGHPAIGWPDLAFEAPARPRTTAPRPVPPLPANYRNLSLDHDFVAGALAADARNAPRELWLGLALAGGVVALFASGLGVPALAVAFTLAPFIGIGMEIFSREE